MTKANSILIAGAGEAGRSLLDEFKRRGLLDWIVGFADDDPAKAGFSLYGKSVLGGTKEIPRLAEQFNVKRLVIAMPSVSQAAVKRLVGAVGVSMKISIIPSGEKYFDTVPLLPSLADVSVADLLDREEATIDVSVIQSGLSGKRVLVTGAGGSIGSEICRQLLKFNPEAVIALGRGEFSIYSLIRSLKEYTDYMAKSPNLFYRIADIKDKTMLAAVFAEFQPHIVFHAAAHKHVPLMEYNELEALRNNVLGTINTLDAAAENGSQRFVLISTDKAVRPASIMGATKRLAEEAAAIYLGKNGLLTCAVRFGNVLGSRGSVIPLFMEQIKRGGPVTVTHPDVSRYFMTIPEAALLVINAAAAALGGETFVLDMGKPYKLSDVACRLIELYGLTPHKDIGVAYTGLRPGEKLHEDIFHSAEGLEKTSNNKIWIKRRDEENGTKDMLQQLPSMETHLTGDEVRSIIKRLVPDYTESPKTAETAARYIN